MNYMFLLNHTGTRAWRVYPIAQELEQQGHQVVAIDLNVLRDDQWQLIQEWADVLIFQMVSSKLLLKQAKQNGIYTIFDCDDLIDYVPPQHPQFKVTNDKQYQGLFKYILKNVDMVTVSSKALYDKYSKLNKNIILLHNYLPETWERQKRLNVSNKIRLGWAGGVSHQEDLDFVAPVIKNIIDKYPIVKLVYTGGGGWNTQNPDSYYRFGEDKFKNIPYRQKEFNVGTRVELWPDKLNSMQLDIALAPLDDNKFSRCKTHIKYFEYGINHWAGVYQKFLYGDVVKHGVTGYLATTQEEFVYYIERLIKDKKLRSEIGERAYNDVKNNHTFSRNKDRWLEIYRSAGERSSHRDKQFFVAREK